MHEIKTICQNVPFICNKNIPVSSNRDTNLEQPENRFKQIPELSKERKLFLMASCMYLQFAALGMMTALSVIYVELINAFNAPRSDAALVQSLYFGIVKGGGIVLLRFVNQFEVGKCVIYTSVVGTGCLIGSSFAEKLPLIIVFAGVVLGLCQCFNMIASSHVIYKAFGASRKQTLMVLLIGQSLGQVSISFLTDICVEQYGWRGTFLLLSAFMSFQGIPIGLIIHAYSDYARKANIADAEPKEETKRVNRHLLFLLYITGYFLFSVFGAVEHWFSVDLAIMRGFTANHGAIILSINGMCTLFGRLASAFIVQTYPLLPPELPLVTSLLMTAVSHAWIVSVNMYLLMTMGMVLRGLSVGMVFSFQPAMQMELRGEKRYQQSMCIAEFVAGSSQIIGGFLGGHSADKTGGYAFIFYAASATTACSSVCMMLVFINRKRKWRRRCRQKVNKTFYFETQRY